MDRGWVLAWPGSDDAATWLKGLPFSQPSCTLARLGQGTSCWVVVELCTVTGCWRILGPFIMPSGHQALLVSQPSCTMAQRVRGLGTTVMPLQQLDAGPLGALAWLESPAW